jgi:hypothetical protein
VCRKELKWRSYSKWGWRLIQRRLRTDQEKGRASQRPTKHRNWRRSVRQRGRQLGAKPGLDHRLVAGAEEVKADDTWAHVSKRRDMQRMHARARDTLNQCK